MELEFCLGMRVEVGVTGAEKNKNKRKPFCSKHVGLMMDKKPLGHRRSKGLGWTEHSAVCWDKTHIITGNKT